MLCIFGIKSNSTPKPAIDPRGTIGINQNEISANICSYYNVYDVFTAMLHTVIVYSLVFVRSPLNVHLYNEAA